MERVEREKGRDERERENEREREGKIFYNARGAPEIDCPRGKDIFLSP